MRYFKYPWKSATIILSILGILLCSVVYIGIIILSPGALASAVIAILLTIMYFRLKSDVGELVMDARARWKGP